MATDCLENAMSKLGYFQSHLIQQRGRRHLLQSRPLLVAHSLKSGKAEAITWRAVRLTQTEEIRLENPLAITFTSKAGMENDDCIHQRLPQVDAGLIYPSAFHAPCADMRNRRWQRLVMPQGFRILGEKGAILLDLRPPQNARHGHTDQRAPRSFFSSVAYLAHEAGLASNQCEQILLYSSMGSGLCEGL